MSDKVKRAVNEVRKTVSRAATGLSKSEYDEYLEELIADAEGWQMELNERKEDEE